MGEPLFDRISLAIVAGGILAVLLLQLAHIETASTERQQGLRVIGHLCLGTAVSLFLFRWVGGVMSLPASFRPNLLSSGALSVTCGIGLVAATKSVIGRESPHRIQYLAIVGTCGVFALGLAAAWEWALLALVLVTSSLALARWKLNQTTLSAITNDVGREQPREPVLVVLVSAALLLLLLGTWQHVVDHEAQRKTRSPRYSAWPRPTALRDAWERTDWAAKRGDAVSETRVTQASTREQLTALGLGFLLLVVVTAAWKRSCHPFDAAEIDHAS